jgi:hypothetical protein
MSPPPGYVAYGGPGAHDATPSRIGGLSKALVILNIIGIVAGAIALLVQLALRNSAIDFRNGDLSSSQFADKAAPYLAATGLAGLVSLAALIVQIIWTFRMAKNLRTLGRPKQSFSPGVTIAINILGGCTLGILPYFMWRELWKGSDPTAPPGDLTWKQRAVGQIVHIWFAVSLLTVIASFGLGAASALTRVNRGSDTSIAKQLDNQIGFVVVAGVLGIITSILFISLVRQLSARHMQSTREA